MGLKEVAALERPGEGHLPRLRKGLGVGQGACGQCRAAKGHWWRVDADAIRECRGWLGVHLGPWNRLGEEHPRSHPAQHW